LIASGDVVVQHRVRKRAMQAFKLQHFAAAHPQEAFPLFTTITSQEIERLREHLCQAAGTGAATDWGHLYRHLLNQAERIRTANPEDESRFNLDAVLKSLGILPDETVYLAWDPRRADVDRMAFADLSRYFDWIWYPASDDIAIFDESFAWLVFVDHEGQLSVVRLR
jgi:hypothetical protein